MFFNLYNCQDFIFLLLHKLKTRKYRDRHQYMITIQLNVQWTLIFKLILNYINAKLKHVNKKHVFSWAGNGTNGFVS